jgi:hypothetical protein
LVYFATPETFIIFGVEFVKKLPISRLARELLDQRVDV